MSKAGGDSFKKRLEESALPYILVTSLATSLAKLESFIATNGLRLLAVSSTIVAIAWLRHVFTETEPSLIQGGQPQPRYKTKQKYIAILLLVLTFVSLLLVFRPKRQFEVPGFDVLIWNHFDSEVHIEPRGFFSLSIPSSPVTEDQVGSGKVELEGGGQPILVPPGRAVSVAGGFVASHLYEGFYNRGDVNFRIVLNTTEGKFFDGATIPFAEDWIVGEPIVFYVGPTSGKIDSGSAKK